MCCLAMFSSQFRGRGLSLIIAISTFSNISAPSIIDSFLTLMMTTVAKQWSVGQRLILYVHPYSPVPIKIGVLYRPPLIPHVVSTIFFFELLQCGLYWKKIKKSKLTKTTLGNRHVDSSFFSILPLMGERGGGISDFQRKLRFLTNQGRGIFRNPNFWSTFSEVWFALSW